MTREEAKAKLEDVSKNMLWGCGEYSEALDIAIKALKQEPTTKNDLGVDCISRTRAIERLKLNFPISQGADNSRDRHRYMQALADLQAIRELPSVTPQPRWIPVKFRPLTDEEKNEYPDYCYMADCLMPDDGQEILVCTAHGSVEKDECVFEDGFYLDSGYDWQTDIVAWMPLPQPYKAETEDTDGTNK